MSTEYCVCGAAVEDVMAYGGESLWVHVPGSDTRCARPRRIAGVTPDRELIRASAEQIAALINRTRRAAGEIENFQSAIAELAEDVDKLKQSLELPAVIRATVLSAVWERLVSAGLLDAALVIGDMLWEAS